LYWENEICEAAWCLWQVDKSNLLVTDVLIKIINKSSKEWVRSKAAEILGLIEPENLLARQTLVQILRNYENKDSSLKVLKSLSMIDYYNEITVEDLLKLIQIKDSDLFYREELSEILERISLVKFEEKQRSEIIYQLSLHLTEQKYVLKYGAYRSLLWNCAQSMIYSDFYKSWYHK
jgi:HEAT repeat protein